MMEKSPEPEEEFEPLQLSEEEFGEHLKKVNDRRDLFLYQYNLQRRSLAMSGILDLSSPQGDGIKDVKGLGTQKLLKTLNVSNNSQLVSLSMLQPQPKLLELIADNTGLDSYAGFGGHICLKTVSVIGTPISEDPHFRLSMIIVAGPTLAVLNGKKVTYQERKTALSYPMIARELLISGNCEGERWQLVSPSPSSAEYVELAMKYEIPSSTQLLTEARQAKVYKPVTIAAKEKVEFPPIPDTSNELAKQLSAQLRTIGIGITENESMQEEILQVLEKLAQSVASLNDARDKIIAPEEFTEEEESYLQAEEQANDEIPQSEEETVAETEEEEAPVVDQETA